MSPARIYAIERAIDKIGVAIVMPTLAVLFGAWFGWAIGTVLAFDILAYGVR